MVASDSDSLRPLCVAYPCNYSAFRDVPDNQEVFSDAATDQSIIIEILERSADVADDAFLAHVFSDLVDADDAATLSPSVRVDSRLLPGRDHRGYGLGFCGSTVDLGRPVCLVTGLS